VTGPPQEHGPALNTDRELWRERPDDFYAPSVFVTESGGIGMNVGGTVFVKPIRAWFALAEAAEPPRERYEGPHGEVLYRPKAGA